MRMVLYVMTSGDCLMHKWSVDNLDFQMQVSHSNFIVILFQQFQTASLFIDPEAHGRAYFGKGQGD